MWLKKLKNKKTQFVVLGLILAFAAMLLSACLSFSVEVEEYTNERFSREQNADLFLYATSGSADYFASKVNEYDETATIEDIPGYHIDTMQLYHGKHLVSDYITPLFALELTNYQTMPYTMDLVASQSNSNEGNQNGPQKGEVWVQKIIADQHDIKLGDSFVVKGTDMALTVSGIVNDNTKAVSMSTGAFVYYNPEDSSIFSAQKPFSFISITSIKDTQELTEWVESQYTNEYYALFSDTLPSLKEKATLLTSLISKMGTLSAMFMFFLTIVIILFFIRNTILNEFGTIGTYKSVGFSSKEIIGFYMKAYLVVGICSIVIGALLGLPVSIFIGNIIMEYMGTFHLSTATIPRVCFVILFTILLLIFSIYLALKRIRKISPVDAFHIGTTSTKAKLKKSILKSAHSSFGTAINDIWKYRNRSILVVIVVTFSLYVGTMLINMCNVFDHMENNASAWVALPGCDAFLSQDNCSISDELLSYVENSPYVESYITGTGLFYSDLRIMSMDTDINLEYASIMSYDTYDVSRTGIEYAKGRPPKNDKEVAFDYKTLQASDYTVGDTITLLLEDEPKSYLITGIFHSMMSPSVAFVNDAFSNYPKENYYTTVGVNLYNESDKGAFEADFKKAFPNYRYGTMKDIVDNIKQSVMSIMVPVTMIIIGIFCCFTLLNIINLILMNQSEQKRNFGIMKAFGFTNSYIIRRNVYRITLLSVIGAGLALLLNYLANAKIFCAILTVDAYETTWSITGIYYGIALAVIILITLLLSRSIRRISPKELME